MPRYDQHSSGEHPVPPCNEHHVRISALEEARAVHSERIAKNELQLGDGRVEFAELRKDLQAATKAIEHLAMAQTALATQVQTALSASGIRWGEKFFESLIFWAVPVGGSAMFWLIVHSGAIK